MEKKIEFKNVKKIDGSVFQTKPSIDIDKMIQNGEIVFTTKHPEGVKRAERVSSIPKIEVDEEKVIEIADQIKKMNTEIDSPIFSASSLNETMNHLFEDGIIPQKANIRKVVRGNESEVVYDPKNNRLFIDGEEVVDD